MNSLQLVSYAESIGRIVPKGISFDFKIVPTLLTAYCHMHNASRFFSSFFFTALACSSNKCQSAVIPSHQLPSTSSPEDIPNSKQKKIFLKIFQYFIRCWQSHTRSHEISHENMKIITLFQVVLVEYYDLISSLDISAFFPLNGWVTAKPCDGI